MLQSVSKNGHTLEDCKEYLRKRAFLPSRQIQGDSGLYALNLDMVLDPGFKEFYKWCKDNDIPFIIVSRFVLRFHLRGSSNLSLLPPLATDSGMEPLIRAILENLIGEKDANEIEIIANDVKVFEDGTWDIQYRHPSRYVLRERRSTAFWGRPGPGLECISVIQLCALPCAHHRFFRPVRWMQWLRARQVSGHPTLSSVAKSTNDLFLR